MMGAALLTALCLSTIAPGHAHAADTNEDLNFSMDGTPLETPATREIIETSEGLNLSINGTPLETPVAGEIHEYTTYVDYWPILLALDGEASAVWEGDGITATANGAVFYIQPGSNFLEVNGRFLYLPHGVRMMDGVCMLPVRALAWAFDGSAEWDENMTVINLQTGEEALQSAENGGYDADTLYWLSHIIYAESGNQPLEGKIAVGNVVLNRVASPIFPNTVYEVVFQRNQFTPVANGTIYAEPNEESVQAAKMCMDGANTIGNALYFVNPKASPGSWASRNRPYIATIGAHAFFG